MLFFLFTFRTQKAFNDNESLSSNSVDGAVRSTHSLKLRMLVRPQTVMFSYFSCVI